MAGAPTSARRLEVADGRSDGRRRRVVHRRRGAAGAAAAPWPCARATRAARCRARRRAPRRRSPARRDRARSLRVRLLRLGPERRPVDDVVGRRHRAGVADGVRHHRGEEDQRPGRRRLPLAVDVGLDRAFLDDDQLFVLVGVRRMRRAARLERGGVVFELVERRGRRREDAAPRALLGRRSRAPIPT